MGVEPRTARTGLPYVGSLRGGLALSQLPALDGLRAVAAFLVVMYHFGVGNTSGGLGVLTFFVLSGFLITWLLLKEYDRYGNVSLRQFYTRRSLRIFPAFYCYFGGLLLLLVIFNKRVVWGQAAWAALYVSNYYQAIWGDPNTGFSHAWSLAIEEQFYLLWAPAFVWLRKRTGSMLPVLASTIGALWIYRAGLVLAGVGHGYVYEAFDTRADHLLIGCALAVMLREERAPGLWNALCGSSIWPVITVGLLATSTRLGDAYGTFYRDVIGFAVEPVLVAVLIPQLIAFRGAAVGAWLNWAWVRYLGRISYSVYLYQQIVVGPAKTLLATAPAPVQLLGAITVIIALGSASYYLVERPFLRLKKRIGSRDGDAAGASG